MEVSTVPLGDVRLAVAESGRGGVPLLLLHGFTGAKEDFTPWLDALAARGFHAVAPDHRGHGDSTKPADEAAYSLEIFAADALALVGHLGWERFHLVGHSMGGMIAQHVALAEPERVASLVLMDTGHGTVEMDAELAAWGLELVRSEGIDALADVLTQMEGPLHSDAYARLVEARPEHKEFGERKLRASSPAMYAAMGTEMMTDHDRLDALRRLRMPTLVLVGDEDLPFVAPSERMADAIGAARLAVVPAAGHSPQFENPESWEKAFFSFLDEQVS
ncbi:MAG: alpha/beta hydrolase [Acidimicrobiales bacterium]|nr:alpha/beta hydrolase [Acidimicrobiales bacterium]MCB9372255.1 alpha/beta hydrolase [Microthrixaceae bacterium]